MEILNNISSQRYNNLLEFLAFLGVYDDEERLRVYKELIEGVGVKDKVVVELGAGFGYLSVFASEMGARRVYAVERNPYVFKILKKNVKGYKNIQPIKADALKFDPGEEVDVLIHDFYGPLLYDESLYILDNLKFKPKAVIPNGGVLKCGVLELERIGDPTVDIDVLKTFKNILVADLFDYYIKPKREFLVASWEFGKGLKTFQPEIPKTGEVLVFWLEILHNGKTLCSSYDCRNWPLVFTYNQGGRFILKFSWRGDYSVVRFGWIT
ncbi:MAG: rRNA adenine N-6-methyltransferase family protein [candidate division WOR-3 bacterium]